MNRFTSAWQHVPVILQATLSGALIGAVGYAPRNALFLANLKTSPRVPWSPVAVAVYLWLMWRYLDGAWWPHRTANARRRRLRGHLPSGEILWPAVTAGFMA